MDINLEDEKYTKNFKDLKPSKEWEYNENGECIGDGYYKIGDYVTTFNGNGGTIFKICVGGYMCGNVDDPYFIDRRKCFDCKLHRIIRDINLSKKMIDRANCEIEVFTHNLEYATKELEDYILEK